jgi:hypothetical protein
MALFIGIPDVSVITPITLPPVCPCTEIGASSISQTVNPSVALITADPIKNLHEKKQSTEPLAECMSDNET